MGWLVNWLCVVVLGLAGPTAGRLDRTQALLDWIEDLGGGVYDVRFQSVPGMGIGLVTTKELEVYTTIVAC